MMKIIGLIISFFVGVGATQTFLWIKELSIHYDWVYKFKKWNRQFKLKYLFTKRYWLVRKLNKEGIIKRVYCIHDSFSSQPNCEMVSKGRIYHVTGISRQEGWYFAGSDIFYTLKETNQWVHCSSIFVDYDEPQLDDRIKLAVDRCNQAINDYKKRLFKDFKFLGK